MTASETDSPDPAESRPATVPGTAAAGKLTVHNLASRPALLGLLALAVYLAAFLIGYAFPLLRHPSVPQVGQYYVDPNFYVWSWRWWPYAISHGLNPLYSSQLAAPSGLDLAWATTTPAVAMLMAPLTVAFGPVASFNLTLVLGAPVSAWAAFLVARRLTGRFWAALTAGAVYGFSWYEVNETGVGHPNVSVIVLLPLMLYLVLLWRDGKLGRRSFIGLMAVAMAAQFLIFNEIFAEMTALGAVGLLIGYVLASPAGRQTVARLAGLVAVAFLIAIVLVSPYLLDALRHFPAGFTKTKVALNLRELVVPQSGIPLLVMALALAVLGWRSRLTRLLVILFLVIVALAVGPQPTIGATHLGPVPWAGLWKLPFARSAEPLRLMIFGYLVLAIIVALWLAIPVRNKLLLASRWGLGLAAAAAILANLPAASVGYALPASAPSAAVRPAYTLPAFISAGLYRDHLRPGEIVVVVSDRGNAGLLFQAVTNFYIRIAGGFINSSLSQGNGLPAPVAQLHHPTPARERQFRAYVRQAGVGAILVERAWAAPWMQIFSRMGLPSAQAGGVIVYRTG